MCCCHLMMMAMPHFLWHGTVPNARVASQLVAEVISVQKVCCGQRHTTTHPRVACCCHDKHKRPPSSALQRKQPVQTSSAILGCPNQVLANSWHRLALRTRKWCTMYLSVCWSKIEIVRHWLGFQGGSIHLYKCE